MEVADNLHQLAKSSNRIPKIAPNPQYIPKRVRSRVEKMNNEKVAVRGILEVLGVKD